MELFEDDHKTAYLKFLNGVLKITTDEIELIDYKDLKDRGGSGRVIFYLIILNMTKGKGYLKPFLRSHCPESHLREMTKIGLRIMILIKINILPLERLMVFSSTPITFLLLLRLSCLLTQKVIKER